jgi:hypothetical protein
MNKPTPDSSNPIERLLQDRAQFVSWLTRLNSSGDAGQAVPEAVRGRVRADYERRLEAVLDELRGHTSALEEQVDVLSARAKELAYRESQHKEQLAEAEVRHVVGEYDDVKWEGIRAELLKLVSHIRDELNHTIAEIDRLNEVLGTIRAPLVAPAEAPEPPSLAISAPRPALNTPAPAELNITHTAPAPALAPERNHPPPQVVVPSELQFRTASNTRSPAKPPAVPPPPAAKKEDSSGRTLWFPTGKPDQGGTSGKLDELAFLKSVTGGEATPPSAPAAPASPPQRARPSGGFKATEVPAAPPIHPPAPAPVAGPAHAPAPAPPPEPVAVRPAEPVKDRPSQGQKTLKCGECGTLNRPTEWYCERCGAELAAL